jgi:hypothetical protein
VARVHRALLAYRFLAAFSPAEHSPRAGRSPFLAATARLRFYNADTPSEHGKVESIGPQPEEIALWAVLLRKPNRPGKSTPGSPASHVLCGVLFVRVSMQQTLVPNS